MSAAKKLRQGPDVKEGIIVDGMFPLIYDGPKDVDKLWKSGEYRDTRGAIVKGSRIMRTRPIFRSWGLKFTVSYMEDIVSENSVRQFIDIAALRIGLSTYRPKYGRFEVISVNAMALA